MSTSSWCGAAVAAVDVGHSQLAAPVRADPRVGVLERTNVRELEPERLGGPADLVVGDLLFISLTRVLPALARCAHPHADHVLLLKPQYGNVETFVWLPAQHEGAGT
ncbi:MAG: SAM-dependent methyltransferase [Streptosporangiales bacterium]